MAELWHFVHHYVKKENEGIVLLLFQSEASIFMLMDATKYGTIQTKI